MCRNTIEGTLDYHTEGVGTPLARKLEVLGDAFNRQICLWETESIMRDGLVTDYFKRS